MTSIDICIPTFRRDSLADTVASIAAQELDPNISLRIIVADNDETRSAEPRIVALAARIEIPLTYVHAPARNISIARNALLEAATADWVAMIDDDETAAPDWLGQLLRTAQIHGAHAVFGPSIARYDNDAPGWIVARDYHSNIPLERDGEVRTGHTSNALIKRTARAFDGLRFDLAKGQTGGEDTAFFFEAHRRGAKMALAQGAMVFEPVEPARLSYRWLARRKFRAGQSWGYHAWSGQGSGAVLVKRLGSGGKALASWLMAGLTAWSQEKRNYWALRATFHAGVVSTIARTREQALYSAD